MKPTFGQRLRSARLKSGLTQMQLADKAGVGRNTVPRLERGEQQPLLETARRLEKVLGTDLLGNSDE